MGKALNYGQEGETVHHDGHWALVGDLRVPGYQALLRYRAGEVAWSQDHAPLCTGRLGVGQQLERIFDALRRCAGQDGIVFESGICQCFPQMAYQGFALESGYHDRLSRRA